LQSTGNPLDLALEGRGFFAVQTANGVRYTRDGSFHRSSKGLVLTGADEPVLSSTRQQILIPPGEVSVGADGVLSIAGGSVANVGVFDFASTAVLVPEGANRYIAPQDAQQIQGTAQVHQGALEASNEDLVQGTLELILMQRQAEMMQKALTVFHTDFNKFATEDLPRV
jgi:flagellar basal-body rod protein FlgF/flagellar basal-body rod protein FlgG